MVRISTGIGNRAGNSVSTIVNVVDFSLKGTRYALTGGGGRRGGRNDDRRRHEEGSRVRLERAALGHHFNMSNAANKRLSLNMESPANRAYVGREILA